MVRGGSEGRPDNISWLPRLFLATHQAAPTQRERRRTMTEPEAAQPSNARASSVSSEASALRALITNAIYELERRYFAETEEVALRLTLPYLRILEAALASPLVPEQTKEQDDMALGNSAGKSGDGPAPVEATELNKLFNELELALYGKTCNTWDVRSCVAVRAVLLKACAFGAKSAQGKD